MANPLFSSLNKQQNNPISAFMAEVRQFQQTFQGNPKDEVQKMMNSGRISQSQFNQYAQMANQIMSFMGK